MNAVHRIHPPASRLRRRYYALQESILFRLAPFLWIKNLAAPDMLFYWGQSIPWINRPEDHGSFLYLVGACEQRRCSGSMLFLA